MKHNLIILNPLRETVGLLSNNMPSACPFYDDKHVEDLDTFETSLEFKVPANHEQAELLEADGYILYPNRDYKYNLFRIKEIRETLTDGKAEKLVYSESAAFADLLVQISRPGTYAKQKARYYYGNILSGTDWVLGTMDDFDDIAYNFTDHTTALQRLLDFSKEIGAEIEFEAKMKGSSVDKLVVNVYRTRGEEVNKPFYVGRNIKGLERKADSRKLVTAMFGVGKDAKGKEFYLSGSPSLPSGYKMYGDIIYSTSALNKYGVRGDNIIGIYKSDKARTVQALADEVVEQLKKYSKPVMTYTLSAALLESITGYEALKVKLGDSIMVHDDMMTPPVRLRARVRKLTRSLTDPSKDTLEMGDVKEVPVTTSQHILKLQSKIEANEVNINSKEDSIVKDIVPPTAPATGQLWLDTSNNTMYKYNGLTWDKVTRSDLSEVTGQVSTGQIGDGAVTEGKIGTGAVSTTKIANLAVNTAHINDAAITTAKINDAAISNAKIANLAVDSAKIQDAAITNAKIGNLAVSAAKIADATITSAKIADATITGAKIANATIDNANIKDAAITSAKIASATIDSANIKDAAITTAKIGTAAITNGHLGTGIIKTANIEDAAITDAKIGSLTAGKISAGTIDTAKVTVQGTGGKLRISGNRMQIFDNQATPVERVSIGDVDNNGTKYGFRVRGTDGTTVLYDQNGVYNEGITDGAITNPKIGDDAVDGRIIAANAITAEHIVAGSITGDKIAAKTITAQQIDVSTLSVGSANIIDGSIGTAEIANAAITNAKIATAAVDTAQIKDAAITNAKIGSLDAGKITTGTLDAARVKVGASTTYEPGYDQTAIEVGGENLAFGTDFSDRAKTESFWRSWNANGQAALVTSITLDSGEVIPFLAIRSKTGLAQGVTFAQLAGGTEAIDMKFSTVAGQEYTLSFLVAAHTNANQALGYTYLINDGGTNQKIPTTDVKLHKVYGSMTTPFNLTVYQYTLTFKAAYTHPAARLMIGSSTAADFTGTSSYGLVYVARVKLEKGNRATSWSKNPKEIDAAIKAAASGKGSLNGIPVGGFYSGSFAINTSASVANAGEIYIQPGTFYHPNGMTYSVAAAQETSTSLEGGNGDSEAFLLFIGSNPGRITMASGFKSDMFVAAKYDLDAKGWYYNDNVQWMPLTPNENDAVVGKLYRTPGSATGIDALVQYAGTPDQPNPKETVIDGSFVQTGTIVADAIRGGTLTLGGAKYGELQVLDENGEVVGYMGGKTGSFSRMSIDMIENARNVVYTTYDTHPLYDDSQGNYGIYVDGLNGDDNNIGTLSAPKQTINGALNALPKYLKHDVVVYILPFVYREDVVVEGFFGHGTLYFRTIIPQVRYIRDTVSDSNLSGYAQWTEIYATDYISGSTNRAAGKTVTTSAGVVNPANIVNDTVDAADAYLANGASRPWVMVDLGAPYDLRNVTVMHKTDGRIFNYHKMEVSTDKVTWRTLWSTDIGFKYKETPSGWKMGAVIIGSISVRKCNDVNFRELKVYADSDAYPLNVDQVRFLYVDYCFFTGKSGVTSRVVNTVNSDCRIRNSELNTSTSDLLFIGYNSTCDIYNCTGGDALYGIYSYSGSTVYGGGTAPKGNTANTRTYYGGTFTTTFTHTLGDFSSTPPAAPTVTQTTKTWSATGSGSYRDSYWDTAKVAQGDWGYGNNEGLWFFGNLQSTLSGKTVKSARIFVTRNNSGGYSAARTAVFGTHNYASRPAGNPTINMTGSKSASFAWGEGKWVDVTSLVQRIAAGTAQGIGIYISSDTKNSYMCFSTAAKLEVTYQ